MSIVAFAFQSLRWRLKFASRRTARRRQISTFEIGDAEVPSQRLHSIAESRHMSVRRPALPRVQIMIHSIFASDYRLLDRIGYHLDATPNGLTCPHNNPDDEVDSIEDGNNDGVNSFFERQVDSVKYGERN